MFGGSSTNIRTLIISLKARIEVILKYALTLRDEYRFNDKILWNKAALGYTTERSKL